ncbi:TetR/AcrR family transcriptional regulator [Microbacterium sp. W4I20]|uniref:TetR/AcrR family transcriptional regulator n=1 Tax=Microbacterium sp. W4I20 TaxID=3042262 RepID=UPI002783FBD2|nr:TetR/AcrR family transcriptional regulator [Microbacterium sp. W4I20]MDQ0729194.1 TetR/AcrR family transcriptional repressor of nem operon [Microbacterium sp. W4I20]
MDTRTRILDAAADLFWERGYSATSPQALQERSGVGQGSMYHHFSGKRDLAVASLRRESERLRRSTADLLDGAATPLDAVIAYLSTPRAPLKGCRLGRMTQEPEVLANDEMRSPIAETFVFYQGRLAALLEAARRDGQLRAEFSPIDVAATLVAIVQGAHVLARSEQSADAFQRVVAGAVQLVHALRA